MLGEAAIEVKANCGKDVIEPVIQKMDFVTEYDLSEDEGVCTAIVRIGENDRQKMQAEMFRIFGENAVPVFQMTPVKASLEDVFIELTHGSSEPDPETEDEEVPQEDAEE